MLLRNVIQSFSRLDKRDNVDVIMLMSFGNATRMVRIVEKERKGQEEKLQTLSAYVANEPRHSNAQADLLYFLMVFA